MSFESLKLPKTLLTALEEAGLTTPLPLQSKVIPRILGGQEIICIAAEGTGKTTALLVGTITRLKSAVEEAPRALILVSDKERVAKLVEHFQQLGNRSGLRVLGVHAGGGIEGQRETIADGLDVIIGTPDRVLALYLKSGLNMNRLQQFILDDAEAIIKQGLQAQVHQLTLSLPKCQRIVFTEVYHDKLERLTSSYMKLPNMVEVDIEPLHKVATIPQLLYQVPNYKTKQNLLNLLMSEEETYKKVVVFVNTKVTAQNLYKSVSKRFIGEVSLLKPPIYKEQGFVTIEDFKKSKTSRILFVANEIEQFLDLNGVSHLFHFDLPEDKALVINRIEAPQFDNSTIPVSITFSTDIELVIVKKIEHSTGNKMQIEPLPAHLIVEGTRKKKGDADEKPEKSPDRAQGAFHEKKADNDKDYNWGWKEKNKLFGKKYNAPKKRTNN